MAKNEKLLHFSSELLRYFRASGLTQAGLAHLLLEEGTKVTGSAVGAWLRGEDEPNRDKVFALEHALRAEPGTFSRLLGYEPPKDTEPTDIRIAASGVDLDELKRIDPEAYGALMAQAKIALDRARDRRPR